MGKDKYPHPKRGERVKCLACNDGWVLHFIKGQFVRMQCRPCKGKGFIVA